MKKKVVIICAVLSLILIVAGSIIKIIDYTKSDVNSNLSENQKNLLAEEFDLNGINSKIQSASYVSDSLRIESGNFDTFEELLDNLSFKSEKLKNMVLTRKDEFTYSDKSISGETISAIRLDTSAYFDYQSNIVIFIFKKDNAYRFIAEKSFVSNPEIFEIFK